MQVKKISSIILLFVLGINCTTNNKKKETVRNNETPVINLNLMNSKVYTSAHNSDYKLSLTNEGIAFGEFVQPLETDASILVDEGKEFQTFLGIGAALTDASAETYFKLPKEMQDKFMESYFSTENGI